MFYIHPIDIMTSLRLGAFDGHIPGTHEFLSEVVETVICVFCVYGFVVGIVFALALALVVVVKLPETGPYDCLIDKVRNGFCNGLVKLTSWLF